MGPVHGTRMTIKRCLAWTLLDPRTCSLRRGFRGRARSALTATSPTFPTGSSTSSTMSTRGSVRLPRADYNRSCSATACSPSSRSTASEPRRTWE